MIRRDAIGAWLLYELPDVALRVGFDETVGAGVIDRCQDDRGAGPTFAMQSDDHREVELRTKRNISGGRKLTEDPLCAWPPATHSARCVRWLAVTAEAAVKEVRAKSNPEKHFLGTGAAVSNATETEVESDVSMTQNAPSKSRKPTHRLP